MRNDARLPVGWNRPHNPKVAGSNPAPATKKRRPYKYLACRACMFSVSGRDPRGAGLQAVSKARREHRVFSGAYVLTSTGEPPEPVPDHQLLTTG